MGADLGREPRLSGAVLDHLQRAQARHRPIPERISPPGTTAAEQGAAAVFADAGGGEVGVDAGLRCVMGGDDVNEASRRARRAFRPSTLQLCRALPPTVRWLPGTIYCRTFALPRQAISKVPNTMAATTSDTGTGAPGSKATLNCGYRRAPLVARVQRGSTEPAPVESAERAILGPRSKHASARGLLSVVPQAVQQLGGES